MLDRRGTKRLRADPEALEEQLDFEMRLPAKRSRPNHDGITVVVPTSSKYPLLTSDSDQLFDLLTKRDAYWTIFDNVASRLPVGDIIALQRSCKATATIYQELLKTHWNVGTRLRKIFKDPVGFRSKLGECGALVTGPFLLYFFGKYDEV
jgi:hypothetical protein